MQVGEEKSFVILPGHTIEGDVSDWKDTQLADLISHLVGGPAITSNSRQALDKTTATVFNKARANLLVVVDGVGSKPLVLQVH